jgi:hypothetical protein
MIMPVLDHGFTTSAGTADVHAITRDPRPPGSRSTSGDMRAIVAQ